MALRVKTQQHFTKHNDISENTLFDVTAKSLTLTDFTHRCELHLMHMVYEAQHLHASYISVMLDLLRTGASNAYMIEVSNISNISKLVLGSSLQKKSHSYPLCLCFQLFQK